MANIDYTHFPYPDDYKENPQDQMMMDINDVIKNESYFFYEFEDCTIEIPLTIEAGEIEPGYYTRHISPLFYKKVVDDEINQGFLDIITEEVPFYYMEPERIITEDDIILSGTRDIGVTNVPSPLQDNDFWMVWFRDAIGFVKNSMLLNVYNKMRYPYIFENQYLNAKVFNRLANIIYENSPNVEARIGFKTTDEENAEAYNSDYEFYGNEVGCLDYIEDIVEKKVNSIYSFIDYNPEYAGFLSDWTDSMYKSGCLTYEEKQEEYLVFKLQDIRGELLRRKFAGTHSLYMLLMNSIGKRGSYIGVITAGDVNAPIRPYYDAEGNLIGYKKSYNNTRPIRIPNIPGVFTDFTFKVDNYDFISTYYIKPDEIHKIPLGTLIPLFYSSADIEYAGGKVPNGDYHYNNELFYRAINSDFIENDENVNENNSFGYVNPKMVEKFVLWEGNYVSSSIDPDVILRNAYKANFFRENSNMILWDSMPGVISKSSIKTYADTLDSFVEEKEGGLVRYRTLDDIFQSSKEQYTLDNFTDVADTSLIYGNVLDITADDILYHRNTLQKEDENNYKFVTYPIADGNGLCLMDTSWLNYLEYYSKQKSKVNEDLTFGIQISTFIEVGETLVTPYEFFTFEKTTDNKGINLYHNLLKYGRKDNKVDEILEVKSLVSSLMTYIRLREDAPTGWYEGTVLRSEYKEAEKFTKYNVGLIPFTYRGITNDKVTQLKIGIYSDEDTWYDDLEAQNLAEVYYFFSDSDLPNKLLQGMTPEEAVAAGYVYITFNSDFNNLKSIYFAVKRIENGNVRYVWSDPIRVFPYSLGNELKPTINQETGEVTSHIPFNPDWKGLVYYLNPYLNFTEESASPLRHKEALSAPITYVAAEYNENETIPAHYSLNDGMPSDYTALSNLVRFRHLDYLCVDDDKHISDLSWIKGDYKGLYLKKTTSTQSPSLSGILIYGDNRDSSNDFKYTEIVTVENINTSVTLPLKEGAIYYCEHTDKYYKLREVPISPTSPNGYEIEKTFESDPAQKKFSDVYRNTLSIPVLHFETLNEGKKDTLELIQVGSDGATSVDLGANWTICAHVNTLTASVTLVTGVTVNCGTAGDHRISVTSSGIQIVDNNKLSETSSSSVNLSGNINILPGFEGDLYDFRLYNEVKTESELKILNAGMFRELYSYAPSNYKLAHSIYVDNSLVRIIDNPYNNEDIYEVKDIDTIRVFSRGVWDSIMVDMFPISLEESDSNKPQYYEYYKNPIDDTDVYKIINDNQVYYNNCIEQLLLEDMEVFNGRKIGKETTLLHNNKRYNLIQNSYVSMVLALMQPIDCKDDPVFSGAFLGLRSGNVLRSVGANKEILISMKADSSDDYFKYSADLNINFEVSPESSFSWFLARGSNVSLRYNTFIKDSLTVLDNTTVKGSENNYILIPLCIPPYSSEDDNRVLDKFYIRDFCLSSGLTAFLNVTSYYSEIRIPVPCEISDPGYDRLILNLKEGDDKNIQNYAHVNGKEKDGKCNIWKEVVKSDGTIGLVQIVDYEGADTEEFDEATRYYVYNENRKIKHFYNKWDAIRTLKEGEYIFTCKYPMKILPFSDEDFISQDGSKDYNTVYGTMRFKIVVSGEAKDITKEEHLKYDFESPLEIPDKYRSYNLKSTLQSSKNRIDPADNYTFPHRKVAIRLYVYDVLSEENKPTDWPNYVTYEPVAGLMSEVPNEDETADKMYTETYAMGWTLIASNVRDEVIEKVYNHAETWSTTQVYYKKNTEPDDSYSLVTSPNQSEFDAGLYYIFGGEVLKDDIIYLNKETLNNGVIIRRNCPLFMSNNYLESFYVSEYDKSSISALSANSEDDDLIDPILIKSDIFSDENLTSSEDGTVEKLNKLILVGGKTYKVLFDYTSNLSEFRYSASEDSDIKVNLIDKTTPPLLSSYVYTTTGESNESEEINETNKIDAAYLSKGTGYFLTSESEWATTKPEWATVDDGGLGDPYATTRDENELYIYNSNSYQIRYYDILNVKKITDTGEEYFELESELPYFYMTNNIKAYDGNDTIVHIDYSEADLIKYHYDQLMPISSSSSSLNIINNLISQANGLLSGISHIKPHIMVKEEKWRESNDNFLIELNPESLPNEETKISDTDINEEDTSTYSETLFKLCSYQVTSWRIPYINNIKLLRQAAWNVGNNLLNASPIGELGPSWTTHCDDMTSTFNVKNVNGSSYVEVPVRYDVTDGHIKFKYANASNDNVVSINAVYTASLKILPDETMRVLSVTAIYYKDGQKVEGGDCDLPMRMTIDSETQQEIPFVDPNGWYEYMGTTSDPVLADSVEFDIEVCGTIPNTDIPDEEELKYIKFRYANVTWRRARTSKIGLSEAFTTESTFDTSMIVVSHTIPAFNKTYTRKSDNKSVEVFLPIQFKPDVAVANNIYRPIPGIYRAASFISSCAVEPQSNTSRIRTLKAPWIRRLNLYWKGGVPKVDFHKYSVKKNSIGLFEYKEVYSGVNDLYKIEENKESSIVVVTPTADKEYKIEFTGGIYMDLAKDGTLKYYNNNLKVLDGNSIALVDEKTSFTYNCFDFDRYRQGLDSYVGVTNIQLLRTNLPDNTGSYDNKEILYEVEYLPIIYNELKNHVSFNIMLNYINDSEKEESEEPEGTQEGGDTTP